MVGGTGGVRFVGAGAWRSQRRARSRVAVRRAAAGAMGGGLLAVAAGILWLSVAAAAGPAARAGSLYAFGLNFYGQLADAC